MTEAEKIAMKIHEDYVRTQKERNTDIDVESEPSLKPWDKLKQTLKYSNIRQARAISDKLQRLGYTTSECSEELEGKKEIKSLTEIQIEYLAKVEHDSWMNERIDQGWVYGKVKDANNKISPYLVPYEELSEDIKELDRDAVRNVIPLLNSIGVRVFEN